MIILLIISIIILLPVIYNFLFPLKPPRLDNYFTSGQTFTSKLEGVTQTIIKQEGDKVFGSLTLVPGAAGPPEHMHIHFDESATITQGTLIVKVNNEIKELKTGDRLFFPKGQYHSFSNETDSEVHVTSNEEGDYLPLKFAYALSQFYPIMEGTSKLKSLHFLLKMAVLDDMFDTYVVDAPLKAQKTMRKILKPYARVLGYSPYDEKSKP